MLTILVKTDCLAKTNIIYTPRNHKFASGSQPLDFITLKFLVLRIIVMRLSLFTFMLKSPVYETAGIRLYYHSENRNILFAFEG